MCALPVVSQAVVSSGLADELKLRSEVQDFFAALAEIVFVWRLLEVCARVGGKAAGLSEPHLSAAADLAGRCRAAWEMPLNSSASSEHTPPSTLQTSALHVLPRESHPASVARLQWRPTFDLEQVILASQERKAAGCSGDEHVCTLCWVPLAAFSEIELGDVPSASMEEDVADGEGGSCLSPLAAMWRGSVLARP